MSAVCFTLYLYLFAVDGCPLEVHECFRTREDCVARGWQEVAEFHKLHRTAVATPVCIEE